MKDKSTAELKADLRALLEWLASSSSGTRAQDARRRVREMKTELEARGETLEPERRSAPTRTERKIYVAQRRVQMVADGWEGDNTLAMHEDSGDGAALCGQQLRDWTDPTGKRWRIVWLRHGPGPVDCGRCANISGEPTGYEPLAEPQGESVRTVSGGAFEMNRRGH